MNRSSGVRRSWAALVLLVLLPLAGCGDPQQDYCAEVEESRKQLAEMVESGSASALLGNLPLLRDLAEQAPNDVADEWQTFLGAVEGLDGALREVGAKPSEFANGKPPEGLSVADRKAVADAANRLGSQDVVEAAGGIEQQARDVCKVNIGL